MIVASVFHPVFISTAILSTILFISWFGYWYKTNLARTEREKAYVCTLLSSCITSTCSLPLVCQLILNGGDLSEILVYSTWTAVITIFFMTFLVLDLVIGCIFYRNKIGVLTGWIHHTVYLGTLTWAIYNQYSAVFIMMCLLELPTFLLALGSVRSQLRRDYLFASAFLTTRIFFHAYVIKCAWKMNPFGPVVNALSVFFPLHCYWFYGFIQQQIRLQKKKNADKAAADASTILKEEKQQSLATNYQEQRNLEPILTKVTTIKKSLVNTVTQRRSAATSSYITTATSPNSSLHQQSPPVSVH